MTADEYIAEARNLVDGDPNVYGSDLSNLLDKVKEWIDKLELKGMAIEGLHALYHFVVDELVPKLLEKTPTHVDIIIMMLVSFFKKLHDAYFPHN